MNFLIYSNSSLLFFPISKLKWVPLIICVNFIFYACDTAESVKPFQNQTYIKLFGGNGSEIGKDLIQLPDEGFVLVGSTTSDTNGGKDVYVVRTDNVGNVIWKNRFGGKGDDVGNSVILGKDNSIYVCGEFTQEKNLISNIRDVYVLKISIENGSIINQKTYGDSLRDEYGTSILDIENGGFLITSTWNTADTSKFFIVETDDNLVSIDKKSRYVGTQGVDNISTKSFENPSDPFNPFVCFGSVYKAPSQQIGKTFWFQSFNYRSDGNQTPAPELYGNSSANDFCTDVFMTSDGGYIISGYTMNGNVSKELVVKINPNLSEAWVKEIDNEFNRNIGKTGIFQTNDGGFLVSSTIELDDPKNDEISLLKLNFLGEPEWRKTYGSNDDDMGSKVIQLEDGSYALIGTIGFEINPDSKSKMCLMKIKSNGDLVPI